ncbi:MAG: hypothetical protein LBB13_01960, partial [Rickettsiales bacterium]|nr:hypothetical protein [Rickettsiales bacterium]
MGKLMNFVSRSVLAIAIIFNIVAVAGAEPTEVSSFGELQGAISTGKTEIAIKNTINFTANGPLINYDNIVISGPSENAPGLLDGNNNYKFFMSGENAKNISLNNLHLSNGNNKDEFAISNDGGAIHLNAGVVVSLEGLTFSNNQTRSRGGAIYSWGTDSDNKNSLNFTGKTTFDRNKTIGIIGSNGGAVFVINSMLTFGEGPATFKGNSSRGNGGAIYAEDSSLIFGKATFKNNSSADSGGAIYGGNGTKLIFGENVTFTENSSVGNGGAIYFSGKNATNKNILKFEGNASFVENSTAVNGNGKGGAISVIYSSLTFGGLAIFKNNSSANAGGAIYGDNGTELTFCVDVTFTGNSSFRNGGAIYSWGFGATNKNILEFRGNAIFARNSTSEDGNGDGGAISVIYSSLTFGGLATFENNRARCGGAIFAYSSASIEFNNGLLLIENTTKRADSGAIDMIGSSENEPIIITIIQRNPAVPTEFSGNKSGGGDGHNAVYMTKYSQLNLTAHDGSIDIFDVFSGDRNEPDNIITINRDNGWVNIEKGGSLENVKVVNRGNLKLAGESRG